MKRATRFRSIAVVAAAAEIACSGPVQAHALDPRMGDFYAGLLHPLTALEHVLPIVALGLLMGQRGLRPAQAVLLVFPILFAAGAVTSMLGPALSWLSAANILWASLLGGLVALAPQQLPLSVLYALAAGMALTHGYANGQSMTADSKAVLFITGLAIASFLALAYVSVVANFVLRQQPNWLRIAVRALGSWIAAIGILVLSIAHRMALSP